MTRGIPRVVSDIMCRRLYHVSSLVSYVVAYIKRRCLYQVSSLSNQFLHGVCGLTFWNVLILFRTPWINLYNFIQLFPSCPIYVLWHPVQYIFCVGAPCPIYLFWNTLSNIFDLWHIVQYIFWDTLSFSFSYIQGHPNQDMAGPELLNLHLYLKSVRV